MFNGHCIENISITGRDKSKTKLFIENNHLEYFDRNISYDVLVNATPSGQENDDIINFLDNCTNLIDLNVNNKDSFLINIANQYGIDISKCQYYSYKNNLKYILDLNLTKI